MSNLTNALDSTEDPSTLFNLGDSVGSGSYGDVYKAEQKTSEEICAIKIIQFEHEEDLDSALSEVKLLKNCTHPNIVSYTGCYLKHGKSPRENYIWFCSGGSVESCYKSIKTPLTELEIAAVMIQALEGLKYLHTKKLIHRDIKAGNLLLTEAGLVKLADFGVSTQLSKTLMKKNTFIGSPYWMAPEIILAEDSGTFYDWKADIWSLGITAIGNLLDNRQEIAECGPPLFDLHPMRVLFTIPKSDPPKLNKTKAYSIQFQDFIFKCLQKNPSVRPEAAELLSHPFVKNDNSANEILIALIEKVKVAKSLKGKLSLRNADSCDSINTVMKSTLNISSSLSDIGKEKPYNNTIKNSQNSGTIISNNNNGSSSTMRTIITKPVVEAKRLCILAQKANCIEQIDQFLYIGIVDGLYCLEVSRKNGANSVEESNGSLKLVSKRKYLYLQVLPKLELLLSISGKDDYFCTHKVSSICNGKSMKKFNGEPKREKYKDTENCLAFSTGISKNDEPLVVLLKADSLLIMEWAPRPFNKFMKLKEIGFGAESNLSVPSIQLGNQFSKIYFAYQKFQIIDIETATSTEVDLYQHARNSRTIRVGGSTRSTNSLPKEDYGNALKALESGGNILYLYSKFGIICNFENEELFRLKWRDEIFCAARISEDLILVGALTGLDIWSLGKQQIVQSLALGKGDHSEYFLLGIANQIVYIMSQEWKDAAPCYSILQMSIN